MFRSNFENNNREKSRPSHNGVIPHSSSLTHSILFFELAPNEPDNQLKEHFSALIAARRLQLRSSLIELESFRLVVSEFASTRLPLFAIHRLDDDIVHVKNDPLAIVKLMPHPLPPVTRSTDLLSNINPASLQCELLQDKYFRCNILQNSVQI